MAGKRPARSEERASLSFPRAKPPSERRFTPGSPAIAAGALVALNLTLLAIAIPDYRVTIDSAYHVSLARAWIDHFPALWDRINFGPQGRPNLQGPLFQLAIGGLGRLLGGAGSSYVLANAILAVAQWAAAIGTAGAIALAIGGEWAALIAVSLISGAAFTSTSFAVGIPSGWVFIFTAWALWFYVRDRAIPAALLAAAAIYVHIGGIAVAGLAILSAALICRNWRTLIATAVIAGVLGAPYVLWVAWHLRWFSGARSHSALLFDPMLDLLAIGGAIWIFRRARQYPLLAAWLIAPLAWLAHDPGRFVLQWALGGGVAAGIWIAYLIRNAERPARARAIGWTIALVATLAPLGIPALASEISWEFGPRYPRAIDWHAAQALGDIIDRSGLRDRLIADYQPALCPAIAVYTPVSCEKGHWVEIQPPNDPADQMAVASKAYILPLAPDDPAITESVRRGWIQLRGGVARDSVVTFASDIAGDAAARISAGLVIENAAWLAAHAVPNLIAIAHAPSHSEALQAQRAHAGRLEMGALLYAAALEATAPREAAAMRRSARGFGIIASLIGDEMSLDYLGPRQFLRLKTDLAALAQSPVGDASAIVSRSDALLAHLFGPHAKTFAERPPGDPTPWSARF